MRLRRVLQLVLMVTLTMSCAALPAARAAAQNNSPDLAATITSKKSAPPSMRLKNISERSCQVATTAQGTVAITKIMQDGKVLQPMALDAASDDDIGYLLQSQLKTLAPGEFVDIPLPVYTLSSGTVLRATTWSSDAGAYSSQYLINPDQPLKLELNYSLPITPKSGELGCTTVFASTLPGTQRITPKLIITIVSVLATIIVLVFLIFWLRRKRRHRAGPIAAAAILLAFGISSFYQAPPAYADIVVPPDMQAAFDGCISTFEANRDITGPVLDVINDPANHIEIVRTDRGSDMTGYDHNFTIYWNPDDRHPYAGSGGSADPCTSLYHEMYHALDMTNRTFSRDDCAGSGIETKEVMATRAQNALRERLGMPARSHYGDRALPSGDCTAPPNPAQCTGAHCGDTNGDPHLRTFDGLRYDFQAVGEFVAARDQAGDYEIQVRQEPWEGSRIVSLNSAIALKMGKDRLEIRAGKAMELVINGESRPLEPADLPGGGKLGIEQGVVVLVWPDDSKAYIRSVGSYGLALSVQPSDKLAGKLEGLLGDANGNSNNDLHARGSNQIIQPTHKELYPAFADSWRITDKTSLFTYSKDKTTASYTERDLPDEFDPKSLPGYGAAEAFCKSLGVSDPAVLTNCALDMAITGRPEFARAAVNSQTFAAGANYGGTTFQLNIQKPGDNVSVTFDAAANEKIFIEVLHSTLSSQCGSLKLLKPDGQEFISGCIINGSGEIDGTVLPIAGQYTIKLAPSNDAAGNTTIRLLRITDKQGTITPDGPSVTTHIDKPGVVSRYTFAGRAGQRVYVDVPTSTLKSQCGILSLFNPEGREFTSGCIINNVGNIDTVVLPADGQYTIAVEPQDTVTGTAQLRLIAASADTQNITMDGPALSAKLSKPGSIALFTFNGAAGQRIFVDIPGSDLPSQCGIVVLRKPDGGTSDSGCIINRKGNLTEDGTVLPVTGQYTIILDPNDAATGNSTIRLRSR